VLNDSRLYCGGFLVSVRRFDTAVRLDGARRTPQGGLRVDAAIARTGILRYRQPDGSYIAEYLPPEEAFKADSLATLEGAPVTKLHPPVMVDKKNWSTYARGQAGENVRKDGDKIATTLYLQDADLADTVERGDMREVSAGYVCDLLNTPGVVPAGQPDAGERYDRVQTNRRYNHVAVVPAGRAGSEVALRLDAAGDAIASDQSEVNMKIERIDGTDYEVGTDAHRAAVERRDAAEKQRKADAEALRAERDALKGERDTLKAKFDAADAELAQSRKDAAARERAALEGDARKVLGAAEKFDGKSDLDVMRAVAGKGAPELRLDGESDAYVKAAFKIAVGRADAAAQALGEVNAAAHEAGRTDAADAPVDIEKARQDMVERNRSRWTKA